MPDNPKVNQLRKETLKRGPFSLEQLAELSRLFSEPSYKLLLRYLELVEAHLQTEVWRSEDWEHFLIMKGERRNLDRLKRAPEEIAQMREALMEEQKNG
jgi:hypothetical protein